MEKKIKKLQLNKETVAVLNGEKMSRIFGGNAEGCGNGNDCPAGYVCVEGVCAEGWITIGKGSCDPCTQTCILCGGSLICESCASCNGTCNTCISDCLSQCRPFCF